MSSGTPEDEGFQVEDLTWREQEILLLLAERCSNREIADQLHLAETTVKDYVSKILSKLYVKTGARLWNAPGTSDYSMLPRSQNPPSASICQPIYNDLVNSGQPTSTGLHHGGLK